MRVPDSQDRTRAFESVFYPVKVDINMYVQPYAVPLSRVARNIFFATRLWVSSGISSEKTKVLIRRILEYLRGNCSLVIPASKTVRRNFFDEKTTPARLVNDIERVLP